MKSFCQRMMYLHEACVLHCSIKIHLRYHILSSYLKYCFFFLLFIFSFFPITKNIPFCSFAPYMVATTLINHSKKIKQQLRNIATFSIGIPLYAWFCIIKWWSYISKYETGIQKGQLYLYTVVNFLDDFRVRAKMINWLI